MLTFTFAGDESGDVSFAFEKGASRYFVVAVIGTQHPEAVRQVLEAARAGAGLPERYEFRFNSLSAARLRRQVFAALAGADFEAWAVIADKPSLPDAFRVMHRLEFYLYLVTEAIQLIPLRQREGATVILDEFGGVGQVRTELRRFLRARGMPQLFRRVLTKRSQSEPLIQVADLIAGAIRRRDSRGDTEAYELIEPKLKRLLEFRG